MITLAIIIIPIYFFIRCNLPTMITNELTFYAIIVALFKEKLVDFYFPPKLEIIPITTKPEDFHEVDARNSEGYFIEKQSWLGIRIKNIGLASAKNVEVYFSGLESNIIQNFDCYRSIPLVRSWIGSPTIKLLPPNVETRWDICYLSNKDPQILNFHFLSTPNALHRIESKPNQKSTFKFKVTTLADNAKTEESVVKITFMGKYITGFKAE